MPVRRFGIPGQFGFEQTYTYFSDTDNTSVHVDILFGMMDGRKAVEAIWSHTLMRCTHPLTGFQRARFDSKTELWVPQLLPVVFEALYGPTFMEPPKKSHMYTHCTPSQIYEEVSSVSLAGMYISYDGLCDSTDRPCISPFGRDFLIRSMLEFVVDVSIQDRLRFSIVCETLRYVLLRPNAPPSHASIGIDSRDVSSWQAGIRHRLQTTSYIIEEHSDGSLFHLVYSTLQPVHLIVWGIAGGVSQLIDFYHYRHFRHGLPSLPLTHPAIHELVTMCPATCTACSVHPPYRINGTLFNVGHEVCLSQVGDAVQGAACTNKVGVTVHMQFPLLWTRALLDRVMNNTGSGR